MVVKKSPGKPEKYKTERNRRDFFTKSYLINTKFVPVCQYLNLGHKCNNKKS